MEKTELDKLVRQWMDEKKVRPSRINRPLTYQLYNELMNPKMKRSEKDCTCLDRDTDLKVTKWIENEYKLEPLPISSNVKIELKGLTAEKPKRTRKKRTTTKKSADEGDTTN
jgi:hypothetical protein